MKRLSLILTIGLMTLCGSASHAQFVKGNEAVNASGASKQVQTPPVPKTGIAKPCPAAQAGCAGGGWNMVETSEGLMECTEIYARPSTCRASTYGKEKRSRIWIVKTGSQWMQCQYPDLASKCVSTKALPYDAVQ
jgi:hypothetical protein